MINIVFEGIFVENKKTIIKELIKTYSSKYQIGFINEIDRNSKIYNKAKKIFDKNLPASISKEINTLDYNNIVDYLFIRKKLYSQNNNINFFCGSYSSIYSYQSVLLEDKIEKYEQLMNNLLNNIKLGEKKIDLLVFFNVNINRAIRSSEIKNKINYNKEEKQILNKFNIKLKDFIRYNNSEYNLLVINDKDNINQIVKKVSKKIDQILIDKNKSEGTKWCELYKTDIQKFHTPDDYIKYKLKYKKKFINKIIKYADNGRVIEAGCGTGLIAGYLQKKGLKVTALDLSQKVLNYANEIAKNSNIIMPCKYKRGNILNLKHKKNAFNVSYSNGVLEHFNDDEIIQTLKQQLNISKYVIFGVPSTYFNMGDNMFGNERRLKLDEWKNLIYKSGGKIVEQTGFHYYKLSKRVFEIQKWFKPKAFWLFIIKKN